MHRIDTPTAQVDKFGAGKNGFTAGNPQTGTPATDLDEAFFDTLQEELAAVVENAGIALDKTQKNQLLTALQTSFQSRDATLTAIAALTGAANKLAYFNGADTANLTDLTPVGRDVIGQSSVANLLSYLGLGSIALAGVCDGVLSANGYIQIPLVVSGVKRNLLIQWGTQSFTPSNTSFSSTITLPTSFPNACIFAGGVGTTTSTGAALSNTGAIDIVCCDNKTTTSFRYRIDTNASTMMSGTHAINWLAIGY